VHREQLIVRLGADADAFRLRQLRADDQRLEPADQEEEERRPEVQEADALVVGSSQPALNFRL